MSHGLEHGLNGLKDFTDGYKKTEVGVIPVDWEVREIRDLNPFITSGSRGWAGFYSDRGAPFIRITNLSRKSIYLDLTDLKLVNLPFGINEGMRTQLQDGDILISITADIGITCYVNALLSKPAYINQHIALVRFDSSKSNSLFLSYFLGCENSQKLFRGSTDWGAKAGMSLEKIRSIKLALPPLPEQKAIALSLSDTDALITACDRAITKKRNIKQGAMQQLLTGKMRLTGFSGEWEVKELEQVTIITRLAGAEYSSVWKEDNNGEIIALRGFNIGKNRIFDKDLARISNELSLKLNRSRLYIGDVAYPCVGTIGNAAVIEENDKYHIQQNIAKITPIKTILSSYYLAHYLISPLGLNEVSRFNATSSQPNVLVGSLRKYRIPLPPLPEQKAIAQILSDMDAEIAALEKKRDKYKAIKQGMMQELLTGKTRLKIKDDTTG